VVGRPKGLLIMNGPSMEKFLPMLAPGGDLIINSSLVEERQVTRNDVRLLQSPPTTSPVTRSQPADGVDGRPRAYVARSGIVNLSTVFECLPKVISKKYEKFIPLNVNALKEEPPLPDFTRDETMDDVLSEVARESGEPDRPAEIPKSRWAARAAFRERMGMTCSSSPKGPDSRRASDADREPMVSPSLGRS